MLGSVEGQRIVELGAGIGRFTGELARTARAVLAVGFRGLGHKLHSVKCSSVITACSTRLLRGYAQQWSSRSRKECMLALLPVV